MKIPKSIINHVAVAECLFGEDVGSDYKYDVCLKDGWVFRRGRMAGCISAGFHTVNDFKFALPTKLNRIK